MSASEKNVLAHSASDELDHESQIHDRINAKEKQAAAKRQAAIMEFDMATI